METWVPHHSMFIQAHSQENYGTIEMRKQYLAHSPWFSGPLHWYPWLSMSLSCWVQMTMVKVWLDVQFWYEWFMWNSFLYSFGLVSIGFDYIKNWCQVGHLLSTPFFAGMESLVCFPTNKQLMRSFQLTNMALLLRLYPLPPWRDSWRSIES